ncbi:hypothetical protein EVAR_12595_1 [Eumeta japonica]|uniref:Uncharacterized protein n=1 Tax=Eumeta variegata TaxID=151549 RepID=A0A4C1UEW8_EUMVA|nr:hypothetical protein EVAR_12595_1 [Eumeta japonica]
MSRHTLAEYESEGAASVGAFRSMIEGSGGSFTSPSDVLLLSENSDGLFPPHKISYFFLKSSSTSDSSDGCDSSEKYSLWASALDCTVSKGKRACTPPENISPTPIDTRNLREATSTPSFYEGARYPL